MSNFILFGKNKRLKVRWRTKEDYLSFWRLVKKTAGEQRIKKPKQELNKISENNIPTTKNQECIVKREISRCETWNYLLGPTVCGLFTSGHVSAVTGRCGRQTKPKSILHNLSKPAVQFGWGVWIQFCSSSGWSWPLVVGLWSKCFSPQHHGCFLVAAFSSPTTHVFRAVSHSDAGSPQMKLPLLLWIPCSGDPTQSVQSAPSPGLSGLQSLTSCHSPQCPLLHPQVSLHGDLRRSLAITTPRASTPSGSQGGCTIANKPSGREQTQPSTSLFCIDVCHPALPVGSRSPFRV